MFQLIYIEKEIRELPYVQTLIKKYSHLPHVIIERYGEVFNRKAQNFRIQKQHPCLILAKKQGKLLLPTPSGYGIGLEKNYYFSHLLNCPFDCRYCFLQGMFASAHYVYFVNHEDFQREIEIKADQDTTFFTGYDCDSLAFESVTGFAKNFLRFIKYSPALFEFRTKSIQIRSFLNSAPLKNVVIAFTLTAHEEHEHKAPSLDSRLDAMKKLQEAGWTVGIRFDPLIFEPDYPSRFTPFFKKVFSRLKIDLIHSVSLGGFRTPGHVFKKMVKLYPKEPLLAKGEGDVEKLLSFCRQEIIHYIPESKLFEVV